MFKSSYHKVRNCAARAAVAVGTVGTALVARADDVSTQITGISTSAQTLLTAVEGIAVGTVTFMILISIVKIVRKK